MRDLMGMVIYTGVVILVWEYRSSIWDALVSAYNRIRKLIRRE